MLEWLAALEARHLADLTFSEVTRALRALSSTYVERRDRLTRRSAFDTAGKQAAYALYYSPLHFLTVVEIVRALQLDRKRVSSVLDLGCGAGAAGAAWAMQTSLEWARQDLSEASSDRSGVMHDRTPSITVTGIDAHPWALAEAAFTYRSFGLHGTTRRGDVGRIRIPRTADAVIAGWVLNEITDAARAHLLGELSHAAARGAVVLVVEPIATRVSPWWNQWADEFIQLGGRADEWRFRVVLPELLRRFDRAAGLRHDVLTARTLLLERPANREGRFDAREK